MVTGLVFCLFVFSGGYFLCFLLDYVNVEIIKKKISSKKCFQNGLQSAFHGENESYYIANVSRRHAASCKTYVFSQNSSVRTVENGIPTVEHAILCRWITVGHPILRFQMVNGISNSWEKDVMFCIYEWQTQ